MPIALLFQTAPAVSRITALDWTMIAMYFGVLLCVAWWVVRKSKDNAADYFLAGPQPGLVDHRRFHLRLQYRFRAHRRTGRQRRHQRCGHGALRTARLVPAGAGVGLRALLHALAWCSPCRSFWSAASTTKSRYVLSIVSPHHLCRLEDRGRHFRRRRGLRHAPARNMHI